MSASLQTTYNAIRNSLAYILKIYLYMSYTYRILDRGIYITQLNYMNFYSTESSPNAGISFVFLVLHTVRGTLL